MEAIFSRFQYDMRHPTRSSSVQIMACRVFGASASPESIQSYNEFDPLNKIQWKLIENTKYPIQENDFENYVCKM